MLVLPGHHERVRCVAYSPDGRLLASCGSDWMIRIWDLRAGEQLQVLSGHRRNVLGLAFSLDGQRLASSANELRFWVLHSRCSKDARDMIANVGHAFLQYFNVIERGRANIDWNVFLAADWRSRAPTAAEVLAADAAGWRLSWKPSRWLAPVEANEIRAGNALVSLQGGDEAAAGLLIEIGQDRSRALFVPKSDRGTPRGTFVPGLGWSVRFRHEIEACFSPDGNRVVATSGNEAVLCQTDGTSCRELMGHTDMVRALAFSPDGETLATSGFDGTVRLWDTASGDERTCYDPEVGVIDSLAFAPDGMTLAAGGKGGIVLWDAGDGF